ANHFFLFCARDLQTKQKRANNRRKYFDLHALSFRYRCWGMNAMKGRYPSASTLISRANQRDLTAMRIRCSLPGILKGAIEYMSILRYILASQKWGRTGFDLWL